MTMGNWLHVEQLGVTLRRHIDEENLKQVLFDILEIAEKYSTEDFEDTMAYDFGELAEIINECLTENVYEDIDVNDHLTSLYDLCDKHRVWLAL